MNPRFTYSCAMAGEIWRNERMALERCPEMWHAKYGVRSRVNANGVVADAKLHLCLPHAVMMFPDDRAERRFKRIDRLAVAYYLQRECNIVDCHLEGTTGGCTNHASPERCAADPEGCHDWVPDPNCHHRRNTTDALARWETEREVARQALG